jgi:hypothetical protein
MNPDKKSTFKLTRNKRLALLFVTLVVVVTGLLTYWDLTHPTPRLEIKPVSQNQLGVFLVSKPHHPKDVITANITLHSDPNRFIPTSVQPGNFWEESTLLEDSINPNGIVKLLIVKNIGSTVQPDQPLALISLPENIDPSLASRAISADYGLTRFTLFGSPDFVYLAQN